MEDSNFKYTNIKYFGIQNTCEEKMAFFQWHINFFDLDNEDSVVLEACAKEEQINMVTLPD